MRRPADAKWRLDLHGSHALGSPCPQVSSRRAAAYIAHMSDVPEIERGNCRTGIANFYLSTAAGNEIFRTIREQGADFW